jgi:hypothetical protein
VESATFILDSEAAAEIPNCKYRRRKITVLSNVGGKWNDDPHITANCKTLEHFLKNLTSST